MRPSTTPRPPTPATEPASLAPESDGAPASAPRPDGPPPEPTTAERILDAALVSFATRGYEASSLDGLAAGLEIRKQTILYWFPSKEALLQAVVDRGTADLSTTLEQALDGAGDGWARLEAVVRATFRLAARRPELLGLVREMGRLGTPAATRFLVELQPFVARATEFLEAEMDAGHLRRHDPRLLLLAIYSTVIGMLSEVEVLRAFGEEPTAESLVRRRREILGLLRSALVVEESGPGRA